jgi:hypothetical protein
LKQTTVVCFQKFIEQLTMCFCFLPWMLSLDFQYHHKPYSEYNHKYHFVFSSTLKIWLGTTSVHNTHGGTLQTYSFLLKVDEPT